MRALCGAIIAAGALIGLGLTALGIGTRYQNFYKLGGEAKDYQIHFTNIDTGLIYAVVLLTCFAVVGLGIAFVGLAFHHERRHREHQLELQHFQAANRPLAPQ